MGVFNRDVMDVHLCVCETVYGVCMRVIMGDVSLRVVECVPEKELKFV